MLTILELNLYERFEDGKAGEIVAKGWYSQYTCL